MNAYEYGLYNYSKKYHPIPNLVIFNDEMIIEDDSDDNAESQSTTNTLATNDIDYEPLPEEIGYFQVERISETSYLRIENPIVLDRNLAEDYLIPNNYIVDLGEDNSILGFPEASYQVYEYEGKYYARSVTAQFLSAIYPDLNLDDADDALLALQRYKSEILGDEVVVYSKIERTKLRRKLLALTDVFLKEITDNQDISLIIFFSEDGAKIENTHLKVDKARGNEIIVFLEKDDVFNIFGTVMRLSTGNNIKSNIVFPIKALVKFSSLFGIDTNKEQLLKAINDHLDRKKENTEKDIIYYLGKVADIVFSGGAWLLKSTFGDGLMAIGNGISDLKFKKSRWEAFDKEGNIDYDKFQPIFPGFESLLKTVEGAKVPNNKTKSFTDIKKDISESYKNFLEIIPDDNLKNYLRQKLSFIPNVLAKLTEIYNAFIKFIKEQVLDAIESTLVYVNALFIGLVNSFIDAIGGVFSLVGLILSLPHYLREFGKKVNKNKGYYTSLVFELLENGLEAYVKLFSPKNLIALAGFTIKAAQLAKTVLLNPSIVVTKLNDGASYAKTLVDSIGYYMGYAIGFIIEEVVIALATGGAANVAQALKVALQSIKGLLTAPVKIIKYSAKKADDYVESLSLLFKKLKTLDVKKALDELYDWIVSFIKTTKQLAEEAFSKLGVANRRAKKVGYAPTKIVDDFIVICPVK